MNGRGFGVVGGATVKKTTLNKKTDSHSSVSGCRIFFVCLLFFFLQRKHKKKYRRTRAGLKEEGRDFKGQTDIFHLLFLSLCFQRSEVYVLRLLKRLKASNYSCCRFLIK